jgi:hypothetical protein
MITAMSADSDVVDVVTAMLHADVHSMPIVDHTRLVGILTRRDLVRASACNDQAIAAPRARGLQNVMMELIAGTWKSMTVRSLSVASSTTPPTRIRPPCWPHAIPGVTGKPLECANGLARSGRRSIQYRHWTLAGHGDARAPSVVAGERSQAIGCGRSR